MKKKGLSFALLSTMLLAGCMNTEYSVQTIENEPYARLEYAGVKVSRGDLTPSFELNLSQENMTVVSFGVSSMELEPDKVYVSRGDKVKAGQILASFKSNEIDSQIDSREKSIEDKQLMIDHYMRLMAINPKENDYTQSINELLSQIEVDKLYIDEYKEKLDAYQIVSTCDGTVTDINSDLENGFLTTDKGLFRVASGSGRYKSSTREDYSFKEGEIFKADNGGIIYEMKLVEITEEENVGGSVTKNLVFEPLSDISVLADNARLTVNVDKETQKDVLYLDKSALRSRTGGWYVYIIGKEGFIEVRVVETGDQVGNNFIIKSGLNGDEEVVLK